MVVLVMIVKLKRWSLVMMVEVEMRDDGVMTKEGSGERVGEGCEDIEPISCR